MHNNKNQAKKMARCTENTRRYFPFIIGMKRIAPILFLFIALFGIFQIVAAAGTTIILENPLKNPDGSSVDSFSALLKTIGDWLIKIGAPIAVLMIIIGGFQIMISGGKPEKIKQGRATILWTIIGYAILIVGWGIVKIVTNLIGNA